MIKIVWNDISHPGIEKFEFEHKGLGIDVWKRTHNKRAFWTLYEEGKPIHESEADTIDIAKEESVKKFKEVKAEMENKKIFNVALPENLVDWLDGRSKRSFQSRNAYVAKLIMEHYEETTGKNYGD